MAAEAAEGPSLPPPRTGEAEAEAPAAPNKRVVAERDEKEQGGEEPKRRRRARISTLESVPRAAEVAVAAAVAGRDVEPSSVYNGDESSFSFHTRSCSSAQTTPKFGSFNPGATADLVASHLMKASRRLVKSSGTEEAGDHRKVAGGDDEAAAEGRDDKSR